MNKYIEYIRNLKETDLYRKIKYLESVQAPNVYFEGKKILLLASNSYLGLCENKEMKNAAIDAINAFGVGSGGSRLTTGSNILHKKLEDKLSELKKCERSLVFSTGYATNIGIIQALANKDTVVFCDRLNHASIFDGIKLSCAKLVLYKHLDLNDLTKKIKKYKVENSILITDGVFSMDGDIAPLKEIIEITKRNNILSIVDDAHGLGVLGKTGSGICEYFDVKPDLIMGTLSKAASSEGGYVCGDEELIEYLIHKARSFIYSTAPSPITTAVSICALDLIKGMNFERDELLNKSKFVREKLKEANINIIDGITPIIPIIIGEAKRAVEISNRLLDNNIFIPAIRPPTVKEGTSRLRLSLMATHSYEDLEFAIKKICEVINE